MGVWRRRWAVITVATTALLASACSVIGHHAPIVPSPHATITSFTTAWTASNYRAMGRLVLGPPADFASENSAVLSDLAATSMAVSASPAVISHHGTRASAPLVERIHLKYGPTWVVHSAVDLEYLHRRWRVVWTPATINPRFKARGHYAATYNWPARAAIYDADGNVISTTPPTSVEIGIEGTYVKDATSLTNSLVQAGATAAEVTTALDAARSNPSAFETVFSVTWPRYEQLRPTLYPIPGVFFQAQGGGGSTPPSLVGVVGSLGAITKEQLRHLGFPYTSSSIVGVSGIEQAEERQLAGRPGMTIAVVNEASSHQVKSYPATPGRPVHTTIDPTIQADAVNALASAPNEAALVAIQASTGKILAVANTSQGSDLALDGEQPPGSTMKVVTSTALIDKGLTPSSPATCPPTIDVDGEILHNAGSEGPVSNLFQAFTVSCNTAFIGLTMANLGDTSLHDAAETYRIGTKLQIGLPVFSGSVPVNDGQTDLAASAIGQARVVMNPLDLAMAAADIDTSTVRTPYLTTNAPAVRQATTPLGSTLVSDLHEMMLSVVQSGTAAGTGLPPGTYAKTGTAEYGSGNPLPLDAWLMGFNGDIAFAMVDIDAPGDGGPTDGPIVAKFLDAIGNTGTP